MKDIDFTTTHLQKKIYVRLINYKNPQFPRTQKQVCEMLGIQKSTCSDATKRLVKLGFIAPLPGMKTNILYRRGKHHNIIESHMKSNYLEKEERFDTYGEGIKPPITAESYRSVFRAHVNGAWMMFTVAVRGELHKFIGDKTNNKGERLTETLLTGDAYDLNGSINWMSNVYYNGEWTKVRYQETASKKLFYVQPSSKIITSDEITPDDDILGPFVAQCRPLLNYLEKYAGWKFRKTETEDYEVTASIKSGKIGNGSQKEYGLDGFMSDLIHDYTGDVGIIGASSFWFDGSENALGTNGECEFAQGNYADAIDKLPYIRATVEKLVSRVQLLEMENLQMRHDALQREHFFLERQSAMYDILSIPVTTTMGETKTPSNNSTGGMYQ